MGDWIDTTAVFLFSSSILILVLGLICLLVMHSLRIKGKTRLWTGSMLMTIPVFFLLFQLVIPDTVEVFVSRQRQSRLKSIWTGSKAAQSNALTTSSDRPDVKPSEGRSGSSFVRAVNPIVSGNQKTENSIEKNSGYSFPWKLIAVDLWLIIFLSLIMRLILILRRTILLSRHSVPVCDPIILGLMRHSATETGLKRTQDNNEDTFHT